MDGVLTDGRLLYGPDGEGLQAFHVHDGLALVRAVKAGLAVAILSSRTSAATARRMTELGISEVHQGVVDKVEVYRALRIKYGCRDAEVAYVGDDLPDLPLLETVGLAIAPADAVTEARRVAHWVTRRGGGRGAVREVIEALLQARGRWP